MSHLSYANNSDNNTHQAKKKRNKCFRFPEQPYLFSPDPNGSIIGLVAIDEKSTQISLRFPNRNMFSPDIILLLHH